MKNHFQTCESLYHRAMRSPDSPLGFSLIELLVVVAIIGLAPTSKATDGSGLTQLRAQLPNPGTILVDHEDPATLQALMTEGSTSQVVPLAQDDHMPLVKGMRVKVGKTYPTPYSVQLFSAPTQAAVKKGDTLIMSCWLRAPEAKSGLTKSGLTCLWLQTTGSVWKSPMSVQVAGTQKWEQVFAAGVADQDYPAGGLQVAIHLGQQQQVLDFAGLVVLNLGPDLDLAKLPQMKMIWDGMAPDAPWRAEAQHRIEKYRMADLAVQVEDAAGKPVVGVTVQVKQQSRAFTIGSFTGDKFVVADTPDGQKMRQIYLRLFNRATCPIYWADGWGWPDNKTQYLAVAKWASDNHFTIRGHVMIYPAYKFMPADVVKLEEEPAKMRQRILQQVREISKATKPFGFREYDVTNELRDFVEVHSLLGRDAVAEWYSEARKTLPNAKLALNENAILTSGGLTQANQDLYLDWYRFLKSKGQAPDVLGFQSHFDENVTAPEKVWAILDRFAKETDAELQITEFDLTTMDEEAQAAYTRDFLTACFAHPRVTGFTMWGFWEGDHWQPKAAFWRKDWSAKPNAIMLEHLLTKIWWTDATAVTDDTGRAVVKAFLGAHMVSATVNGQKLESRVQLNQAGKEVRAELKP